MDDPLWNEQTYPGYQPVQLGPKASLPFSWCDWWGPRSCCFRACQPCLNCAHGRCNPCLVSVEDAADPSIWKATLSIATGCPEEMKGVWWLQDNIAAETLVCFNDALWDQRQDGTWTFRHDIPQTWSRDDSVFGYVLGIVNACQDGCPNLNADWTAYVGLRVNFQKGIMRMGDTEWVFRVNADEWQKATYAAPKGQPGAEEVAFMYRWRRVIRGDGSTTPAFDEFKSMVTSPYPHRNCLEPWCPCWPLPLSVEQRLEDMTYSNRKQLIIWRPEHRKPVCACYGMNCPCPCMCPIAKDVDGQYRKWLKDVEAAQSRPEQQAMLPNA